MPSKAKLRRQRDQARARARLVEEDGDAVYRRDQLRLAAANQRVAELGAENGRLVERLEDRTDEIGSLLAHVHEHHVNDGLGEGTVCPVALPLGQIFIVPGEGVSHHADELLHIGVEATNEAEFLATTFSPTFPDAAAIADADPLGPPVANHYGDSEHNRFLQVRAQRDWARNKIRELQAEAVDVEAELGRLDEWRKYIAMFGHQPEFVAAIERGDWMTSAQFVSEYSPQLGAEIDAMRNLARADPPDDTPIFDHLDERVIDDYRRSRGLPAFDRTTRGENR